MSLEHINLVEEAEKPMRKKWESLGEGPKLPYAITPNLLANYARNDALRRMGIEQKPLDLNNLFTGSARWVFKIGVPFGIAALGANTNHVELIAGGVLAGYYQVCSFLADVKF